MELKTEDVSELLEASDLQMRQERCVFHRYLMDEIDWRDRLICIKGPRSIRDLAGWLYEHGSRR